MKINALQFKSPINIISLLSIIGGILYIVYPPIIEYGMYISDAPTLHRFIQLALYSFLHGGILHILSNVIFFLFIGRIIEVTHGTKYLW
jgi:membrane associated rhomboid family serine protease